LTAVGVDQLAIGGAGNGVDRQIAARQILFQADIGRGMKGKALVAVAGLALGTRQRIFLVRLRVQEDREILADRLEAAGQHFLRASCRPRRSHDPAPAGRATRRGSPRRQ
jgi:hypothetical protein